MNMVMRWQRTKQLCLSKGVWLMRLGKLLSSMTKPELEELRENCNLSYEDSIIFTMLSKNCSLTDSW